MDKLDKSIGFIQVSKWCNDIFSHLQNRWTPEGLSVQNPNLLPAIFCKMGEADSSNRSSIEPWRELWHEHGGWDTRGRLTETESE